MGPRLASDVHSGKAVVLLVIQHQSFSVRGYSLDHHAITTDIHPISGESVSSAGESLRAGYVASSIPIPL